jgi:methylated-DNA-protein-cysteine methyltransferase related protein
LNPNADPNAKYFKKFLATIRRIPHGKVATYGDIAYAAGFPGMARQVAWALHASVPGVPWQRVVGAGGKVLLGGEHGFEQRMRLQQEGVAFIGQRVDMDAHHHSFFARKSARKSAKSARGAKSAKKKKVSRPIARKSNRLGR